MDATRSNTFRNISFAGYSPMQIVLNENKSGNTNVNKKHHDTNGILREAKS